MELETEPDPEPQGTEPAMGLLANHRRTPPQIGSVTLALAPEPSGCDTPPPEIIRAPNTPVPVGPVFGFTGELNPATRVTEEAEMDIPSPPFSSCREGIRL